MEIMDKKRNRLGKGLESLIPKRTVQADPKLGVMEIPVSKVKPNPFQPRMNFDPEALKTLSESILKHGLAQPIIVRKKADHYELVAGERRFRATLIAQKETIPAIIKEIDDNQSIQIAIVENLERKDLNAIELAKGYQRLIKEFGHKHDELSEIFSRSRSAITNTLRLLNLPVEIQQLILDNKLTQGQTRPLLALEEESLMIEIAESIVNNNLSARDAEALVQRAKNEKVPKEKYHNPQWDDIQDHLEEKYNTKVSIKGTPNSGKIILSYKSPEDLYRIYNALQ